MKRNYRKNYWLLTYSLGRNVNKFFICKYLYNIFIMTNFLKKVFQSITLQSIQGYEVDKDPIMLLGQWKVYNGRSKLKMGSVWICDSKSNSQAKKEY